MINAVLALAGEDWRFILGLGITRPGCRQSSGPLQELAPVDGAAVVAPCAESFHFRDTIARFDYEEVQSMRVLKTAVVVAVLAAFPLSSAAQRRDCTELKGEIDAKIKKDGIATFSLKIVDAGAQPGGKVVGTCEGGREDHRLEARRLSGGRRDLAPRRE